MRTAHFTLNMLLLILFLSLNIGCTVSQEYENVSFIGPPLPVLVGDHVSMTCTTRKPPKTMSIKLEQKELARGYKTYPEKCNTDCHYSVTHNISSVMHINAGIYTCFVSWLNEHGALIVKNATYNLEILDALVIHPKTAIVYAKETLLLSCYSPQPEGLTSNISWYKNLSSGLQYLGDGDRLVINTTSVKWSGSYFCRASRWQGFIDSIEASITIKAPLLIESVSPEVDVIQSTDDLSVNVIVSGSNIAEAMLLWSPTGRTSPQVIDVSDYMTNATVQGSFHYGQETAVLFSISPMTDKDILCGNITYFNGNYTFIAFNSTSIGHGRTELEKNFIVAIKDTTNKVEKINVCEGDQIIRLGKCTSCQHQYNWTLDDQPLPDDVIVGDEGLFIPNVQSYHYGVYTAVPTTNKMCSRRRAFRVDRCGDPPSPSSEQGALIPTLVGTAVAIIVVGLICGVCVYLFKKGDQHGTTGGRKMSSFAARIFAGPRPEEVVTLKRNMMLEEVCYKKGESVDQECHSWTGEENTDPNKQVNKDGLVYADLDMITSTVPAPSSVIRGDEDRVEYADLDWDKMLKSDSQSSMVQT